MSIVGSFDTFQTTVNADAGQVAEARRRRRVFESALTTEPDVLELIASGSLARGTHHDPIHDVDLIVVFDADEHADWGSNGESAKDALDHTGAMIHRLLGSTSGTYDHLVRLARWRNHAVKCFLDDPEDDGAFTVDVMPAIRAGDHLLIPEALTESWIECDPEYLIRKSKAKHAEWKKYAGTVRMLKWWRKEQPIKIKSLVMEVLAFDHLPLGQSQPGAIKSFFAAAAFALESGLDVVDPANYCGAIQPDLDCGQFAELLRTAATSASAAVAAQANNDAAGATQHWADIFGDDFPVIAAAVATVTDSGPRPVRDSPQG
jgi:hypothetical protein